MIDKNKTDKRLGKEVHYMLTKLGVETPMASHVTDDYEKMEEIREHVTSILLALGLDLTDDSLCETPKRIAKMYVWEVFAGLNYENFPIVTTIENKMQYDTMLLERHIAVKSFCEHHFVPMMGEAFVAYIPNRKVIGLSKINRIVEFFSRRPQVQERLTEQIFHTLCHILETDNVAVIIKAEHSCVKLRGAEDVNSDTLTTRLGGAFMGNQKLRDELYQAIKL